MDDLLPSLPPLYTSVYVMKYDIAADQRILAT